MKLTFLGTGTSVGVPQMRCKCAVCTSPDYHDKRLRSSVLLEPVPGASSVLIDCGPDFRQQMLAVGCPDLACALITHTHYDHLGGVDDLRPYAHTFTGGRFPLYCRADVAEDLHTRIPYCFVERPYLGVPQFLLHTLAEFDTIEVNLGEGFDPLPVQALPVKHGKLDIFGYRIGKLVYITDASAIPEATMEAIRGIDTFVINTLRIEPHPSHFSLSETLDVIENVKPGRAFLTHVCHKLGRHEDVKRMLPQGVVLAYDGLSIDI